MTWKKGQSGNPSGRPKMPAELKAALHANGARGMERMRQLLEDDDAWGSDGWMDAKTQVKLAETAIVRAFGANPGQIEHGTTAGAESILRAAYDALVQSGDLPELLNARRAVDVTPPDDDEDDEPQVAKRRRIGR